MGSKARILVLEQPWSENLSDKSSVRPFIEGWTATEGVSVDYRMYHGKQDLRHWIKAFITHPSCRICYIAGHGDGGRLAGIGESININTIAEATKHKGPVGCNNKGVLIGACDVGAKLRQFLESCGQRVCWVAGYERSVPWMESMVSDLLFLMYMVSGSCKIGDKGMFCETNAGFLRSKPKSAKQAADWVKRDCKFANSCGLVAYDRG